MTVAPASKANVGTPAIFHLWPPSSWRQEHRAVRPSRSTATDSGTGCWALDARQMRETVAVFDDPAYSDQQLYALQNQAAAVVEALLGAPIQGRRVVDYYACASDRLDLSARGIQSLAAAQFADLSVVATIPTGAETAVQIAALDLSGDAPAVVLDSPPPLSDHLANPLRAEYVFTPASPLPQFVVEAVAEAFRQAFDARYRGGAMAGEGAVEALLGGNASVLGPYD